MSGRIVVMRNGRIDRSARGRYLRPTRDGFRRRLRRQDELPGGRLVTSKRANVRGAVLEFSEEVPLDEGAAVTAAFGGRTWWYATSACIRTIACRSRSAPWNHRQSFATSCMRAAQDWTSRPTFRSTPCATSAFPRARPSRSRCRRAVAVFAQPRSAAPDRTPAMATRR